MDGVLRVETKHFFGGLNMQRYAVIEFDFVLNKDGDVAGIGLTLTNALILARGLAECWCVDEDVDFFYIRAGVFGYKGDSNFGTIVRRI